MCADPEESAAGTRGIPDGDPIAALRAERDLYLRLLSLGERDEVGPFLEESLQLVVDVTGAQFGYIELRDREGEPSWHCGHGYSPGELDELREVVSSGIVAEAIATATTVITPSARLDDRYKNRRSVIANQIGSVLCAPIGEDPTIGVVYLEAKDVDHFDEDDRLRVELVGRHLAPYADRLTLLREGGGERDPLAELRRQNHFPQIIGRSQALAATLEQALTIARLDVTILLTGDSGTGKSQLARAIHDESPRTSEPFVELNCAALPEMLIENELFGAERGAHSTASQAVEGKIAAAERGTLFLDEISELPLVAQAKLLQFVQSRTYYPLGASEARSADVRILTATNTDLEERVAENRFREDLLYRLKVLPLRLPNLSERREDIPLLARHACRQACERNGLPFLSFSRRALYELEAAEWPGNVRQLAHTIEAGAIRAAAEGVQEIEPQHLFDRPADEKGSQGPSFQEATREFQADLVRRRLEESNWNIAETARRLDLTRQYMHKLIRRFGLRRTP